MSKGKNKRFLTETQKMLLREKSEKFQIALTAIEERKKEMSIAVTLCCRELKIPDEENWTLSADLRYFQKQEDPENKDKNGGKK